MLYCYHYQLTMRKLRYSEVQQFVQAMELTYGERRF